MRCNDIRPIDCCLFYDDGTCVGSCISPLIPDDNFNCVCPGFFIYPACTGMCIITLCNTCECNIPAGM